jgi:hypothetical protein
MDGVTGAGIDAELIFRAGISNYISHDCLISESRTLPPARPDSSTVKPHDVGVGDSSHSPVVTAFTGGKRLKKMGMVGDRARFTAPRLAW